MFFQKNPNLHRPSIRLKGFDYTSENGYFITMVTHHRINLFGRVESDEMILNEFGQIAQNEWFKTAQLRPYLELIEDEFVVMPNHIHGIIWIAADTRISTAGISSNEDSLRTGTNEDFLRTGAARCVPTAHDIPGTGTARRAPTFEQFGKPVAGSIPTIIRAYKSAVTRGINLIRSTPGKPVFQRNYYEHIIGSDKEYERIAAYIANNPVFWSRDDENDLPLSALR